MTVTEPRDQVEREEMISGLRRECEGQVLTPEEAGYAEACAAWNLVWSQRPALVVRVEDEADVAAAVGFAARAGLGVAVQTTGHGVTVPADGECVLLVMGALNRVSVDADAATATFGGGATWAPVLAAAQEHGLAPLIGSTPHTGAVSFSLGGGIGWLTREHGLAVDAVRSLRVVLADGRVVAASPTEEPDLFWALCGTGGGALGVVTEMTVALAPVSEVYAGSLFYALEDAREVFHRYRDWSASSPSGLTSAVNITAFPPLEVVPEPLRGASFVIVRGCFTGDDLAEGEALVEEWRSWRAPVIDGWGRLPFALSAEISQDPVDPMPVNTSGRWLRELSDEVLEVMLDAVRPDQHPSPVLLVEARHTGGGLGSVHEGACFAARDGEFCIEMVGLLPDAGAGAELDRRFQDAWSRLEPALSPLPGYLNFVEGSERVAMGAAAFGEEERARLGEVARRYDPHGVFRYGLPLREWAE